MKSRNVKTEKGMMDRRSCSSELEHWHTEDDIMISLQRESTGHHTVSQLPQSAETNGNVNVTMQTD
jgi:hypothetical protein